MTVVTSVPTTASAAPVAEPPARFRDVLAAEWIKMRSLRSTPWTIALTTLFVIGSAAVAAVADYNNLAGSHTSVRQPPTSCRSTPFRRPAA
ncbi:hypothetical protein [Streptomyces sp. NPDC005209]|uniref:hypothetical protein n=1 Tax=Streptomyces sp. NPDC005209 TaxID=3156715 RepID=UPI0033A72A2A